MARNPLETFTAFYDGWLVRHDHLQGQLSAAVIPLPNNNNNKHQQLEKLVQEASDHYREYYEQKSSAMEDDVFLICAPPWYTSFEHALFWVTGFPPSMVFRFLRDINLTREQADWVERVRVETAAKEREIGEAMAMVQESVAVAPLYGLVNRVERLVDGQVSQLDEAMEEAKEAMRAVITEADALRGTAVIQVLKVLGMMQRVKFFASLGEFRIRARRVGLHMDRPRS